MDNKNLQAVVIRLVNSQAKTRADLQKAQREITNSLRISPPPGSALLETYKKLIKSKKIKANKNLEQLLVKRSVRTLSGVAPITVITKFYKCPGKCVYCPSEKEMPKSYLSNEPAVMRAIMAKFDPYRQVEIRLNALRANGHPTDKIELIILGGTWSCCPLQYQRWFIKRCFDGCNQKKSKNLKSAQRLNETAKRRIVGITIETRPDYITEPELKRLREFGVTRVELGVQSIYDSILKLNQRGNDVAQVISATKFLKQAGFKINYHMMPNLPGSNAAKDLKMFKELFSSQNFQPDMLKIYPCIVTKDSRLYSWWKKGKHKPYLDKQLKNLLINIKKSVPPYVRINRLIRDIPNESIIAGNKITNLRQIIQDGFFDCKCIRCREAGHRGQAVVGRWQIVKRKYKASNGEEYFLSIESLDKKVLYAFLRLRINDNLSDNFIPELKKAALIRELHTYGQLTSFKKRGKVQHLGFGKKLMAEAEKICQQKKIKKIAVISGIGVREYYRKLGYKLEGSYMVKQV